MARTERVNQNGANGDATVGPFLAAPVMSAYVLAADVLEPRAPALPGVAAPAQLSAMGASAS